LGRDHLDNNISKVQDTRFNKTRLVERDKEDWWWWW
jgi:hypothetical protein